MIPLGGFTAFSYTFIIPCGRSTITFWGARTGHAGQSRKTFWIGAGCIPKSDARDIRVCLVDRGGLGDDCGDRSLEKVDQTGETDVTTRWYLDGWSAVEERDGDDALQATYVNGA